MPGRSTSGFHQPGRGGGGEEDGGGKGIPVRGDNYRAGNAVVAIKSGPCRESAYGGNPFLGTFCLEVVYEGGVLGLD